MASARADFRRPDRISKEQLRAVQFLHENFARNLASSLSAYLRAYVAVALASVEQVSFAEFSRTLPSPTCLLALAMKPFDGSAVLEINPSLVFPMLEILLGGKGKGGPPVLRELTEIEQNVLEGVHRIVLHDLRQAWQSVATVEFAVESRKTDPQLVQAMSPNEALVAIGLDVRIGENSGRLNVGVPSVILKMLRQKFDQQWSPKRAEPSPEEEARTLRLLKNAAMQVEARLAGPMVAARDLLRIEAGDVLVFDYPAERPLDLAVNGIVKFRGAMAVSGSKRAFIIL